MASVLDSRTGVRLERTPLPCALSPLEVLRAVRDEPTPFALTGAWAGGGVIIGCSPLMHIPAEADPFAAVSTLPCLEQTDEPPDGAVGGGWFGWFGYRLGRRIERLPDGPARPIAIPEFGLSYYDHVLRLDRCGSWWFEALVSESRESALDARRDELIARLRSGARIAAPYVPPPPLRLSRPHAEHHVAAIRDCRERIAAGEIYQANICLRLETEWDGDAAALFEHAKRGIDPPYAGVFCTPWGGIASLSPELFLRRRGSEVVTAPIKGTTGRDIDPTLAEAALARLRTSAKDAAEHVMIVDLMRNDIGRVCEYGSVRAPRIPDAEPHPGLWHLVSRVRGTLRPDADDGDLLRATFPPGSVTGAPKVQAMRVIAELEPTGREAYTGSLGYVSPVAGLELNVAIRTLELAHGRLWLGAGGGIVADSDPGRELEEALAKARPIAAAIGSSVSVDAASPVVLSASRPDPALGVFETMLVRDDGRVQALERHLRRIATAVRELYGADLPAGLAADVAARARSAAASTPDDCRLRVRAVPSCRGMTVEIDVEPLALPDPRVPVSLEPLPLPAGLGPHKWSDRRLLDRHRGSTTVPLIIDRDEQVLEAAWANVWLVEERSIVTPPADGRLLPGVTRGRLLERAPRLGLRTLVEPISLARARRADAIFLTSSLRHAVPAALDDARRAETGASTVVVRVRDALSEA